MDCSWLVVAAVPSLSNLNIITKLKITNIDQLYYDKTIKLYLSKLFILLILGEKSLKI
jgi:hypothetical protein